MSKTNETQGKEKICLGVYIAKELHSELKAVAEAKEIPMSQIVREALKEYVNDKETLKEYVSKNVK